MSGNTLELLASEEAYPIATFASLGLSPQLLQALDDVGYETPSAIQIQTIPSLLTGRDLLGQAQTGTGKTAAFALPLLMRLDPTKKTPQALVLTPTRELAIQVAEAFEKYAAHVPNFRVLAVYGGQGYDTQLRSLRQGATVVVGTPGRVMDHIRRKTLRLSEISTIVLDEADEMLRMGFLEDVEWILEQTPDTRQTALFSATMPEAVRRIARTYMRTPDEVTVKTSTTTVQATSQRYCLLNNPQKVDGLTRILEAEDFDAVLVFVRTKTATLDLDEKLRARGFACAPLNGDIAQNQREKTVEQIKKGKIDIVIATDVAARGLDIDRISHVINFDIPYDTESYVHRIGRTGRAGRSGQAILFVGPRERRMLQLIERSTKQAIPLMQLPGNEEINKKRVARFKQRITDTLSTNAWKQFSQLIEEYKVENDVSEVEIAAALASMNHGGRPLTLSLASSPKKTFARAEERNDGKPQRERSRFVTDGSVASYRIEVGRAHGVRPANIVGAIANEGGISSAEIGNINIQDQFSTVDLPKDLSEDVLNALRQTWVSGQQLAIRHASKSDTGRPDARFSNGEARRGGAPRKDTGSRKASDARKARPDSSPRPEKASHRKSKSFSEGKGTESGERRTRPAKGDGGSGRFEKSKFKSDKPKDASARRKPAKSKLAGKSTGKRTGSASSKSRRP